MQNLFKCILCWQVFQDNNATRVTSHYDEVYKHTDINIINIYLQK